MKLNYEKIHLGQLLKKKLEAAGLKPDQASAVLGQTGRNFRKGYRRATLEIDKLQKISALLGEDLMLYLLAEPTRARMAEAEAEAARLRVEVERLRSMLNV